jgi:toxin ParE1/3/4
VEQESVSIAFELDERVSTSTSRLKDHPYSGRPGRAPGTRELIVLRTPYIAVYGVDEQGVRIIRLIHGAQQWPPVDDR